MPVPTGGILAAESISKAIGDLMKGMFGVEQATPEIQGQIAKQGQAQRQEALSMAQLPQQLAMQRAQMGHLGAQTEHAQAQSELARAQAGAIPATIAWRMAQAASQRALAAEHAAKAKQQADAAERYNRYREGVLALDPTAKDTPAKLRQLIAEYAPTSPGMREILKQEDPLLEQKKQALEALTRERDAIAKSHDPNDPLAKKKIEALNARIRLYNAQIDRVQTDKKLDETPHQEKQRLLRLGDQATNLMLKTFKTETGTDLSTIEGTYQERLDALNWLRQYTLNSMLISQGPEMQKYIDKNITPESMPKALKALEEKKGAKPMGFEWLKKAAIATPIGRLGQLGGLWGTGQKAPSITLPEPEPDEEESPEEGDNDPLGILK